MSPHLSGVKMATEVSICNRALSRIGLRGISAFTDSSKEAVECKLHYDDARNTVLEDFDWGFARKRQVLAVLTETYTGWDYAYQLPSGYIMARKLIDETGTYSGTSLDAELENYVQVGKVKFEIISNDTGSRPILLTNQESAELSYTAEITDVNAFSPLFIDALAWRLAGELAMSLKGKPDLQIAMLQIYERVLGKAKASNANEDYNKSDDINHYVRAR